MKMECKEEPSKLHTVAIDTINVAPIIIFYYMYVLIKTNKKIKIKKNPILSITCVSDTREMKQTSYTASFRF